MIISLTKNKNNNDYKKVRLLMSLMNLKLMIIIWLKYVKVNLLKWLMKIRKTKRFMPQMNNPKKRKRKNKWEILKIMFLNKITLIWLISQGLMKTLNMIIKNNNTWHHLLYRNQGVRSRRWNKVFMALTSIRMPILAKNHLATTHRKIIIKWKVRSISISNKQWVLMKTQLIWDLSIKVLWVHKYLSQEICFKAFGMEWNTTQATWKKTSMIKS